MSRPVTPRRLGAGAAAVRREHDAAGRGLHLDRGAGLGAAALLRRRPGSAWAASRSCATEQGRVPSARSTRRRRTRPADVRDAAVGRGVREHLPAPRARAAARRRYVGQARRSSARTTRGPTTWTASLIAAPGFREVASFDPAAHGLVRLPVEVWHGWVFVNALRDGARRSPSTSAASSAGRALRPGAPGARRDARVRRRRELEGRHRELPRVLPLPADPPGAVPGEPADQRATTSTCPALGSAARWTCATAWRRCRSTAPPAATRSPGVDPHAGALPRAVAQPAALAAPRLRDDAPDAAARARPDLGGVLVVPVPATTAGADPAYAVDFWDLTNRQDWGACESVQRGLASPHFRPGPLAPNEDAVHAFVTRVGRAYQGTPLHAPLG